MSNTKDKITHPGVIDHFEGEKAFVRILSQSACSSCHAKGMCTVSEMEEKIVEVRTVSAAQFNVGDQVILALRRALGVKAVILGYFVPFLVMFLTLIILMSITGKEGLSALLSVLLLVPYYGILYLFKDKLSNEFKFEIID